MNTILIISNTLMMGITHKYLVYGRLPCSLNLPPRDFQSGTANKEIDEPTTQIIPNKAATVLINNHNIELQSDQVNFDIASFLCTIPQ